MFVLRHARCLQHERDSLPRIQDDLAVLDLTLVERSNQKLGIACVDTTVDDERLLFVGKIEDDEQLGSLVCLDVSKDLLIVKIQDLEVSVCLSDIKRHGSA